jgi:lipopolysaccharide export system protein LptA
LKRPPIELFRRFALAGVVVMVVVVAANYGLRRWRAEQAQRAVRAPIESGVQQQAEKFTFSRTEQGQTLFTVEAERTTERAGKTTVLEDVVVRIFGRRGERADEIHTARCEYDSEGTGRVACPGEVRVLLRGEESAASGGIELYSSALEFDPNQSVAWTDEAVRFSFPDGSGEAVGLRYQPQEPKVQLARGVRIQVARSGEHPVTFQGARLHYFAAARVFELAPPLGVRVSDRGLTADRLRLEMDPNYRTRRLEAIGNVRAEMAQDDRRFTLEAERAAAEYSPDGSLEQLRASGSVELLGKSKEGVQRLACREAVFHFAARPGRLERVMATGSAILTLEAAAGTRALRAPELELRLPVERRGQILTARQRGTLTLRGKPAEDLSVTADRLELDLAALDRVRALSASGNVETLSARPGRASRTTRSRELRGRFTLDGRLAAAEQWGAFRADVGNWKAEAGRADYDGESGVLRLREQPVVWDAASRTSAAALELRERDDELRAEGDVRTSRAAPDASGLGGREPVQLAAERMRARHGWARYEGKARLWQGENRLAADSIELFRSPQKLVAEGGVSSLFQEDNTGGGKSGQHPVVIRAGRFHYEAAQRLGVFEGDVRAEGEFGALAAARLEVRLAPQSGALESARASGGVRLEETDLPPGEAGWLATSEVAEYQPEPPVVVLSGGTPTLLDPRRGSTRGARLTLNLADDTISIESQEGARTVTRRPWSQ